MNKCLYCGKPVKNKYCGVSCQNRHLNGERSKRRLEKQYGELKKFSVLCKKCGKEFEVEEREKLFPMKTNYYCSRSCANSREHSEETKQKIKKTLLDFNEFTRKKYKCFYCGKEFEDWRVRKFCSKKCSMKWRNENDLEWINNSRERAIKGGRKSVLSQNRRSKNEIDFANLCSSIFKNIRFNEPIFNGWDADIILDDYKLAILWDGNWHHKQIGIKHSLSQVQNRDRLRIKEIEKFGYKPYIIKDYGKYNKEFVKNEFEKLKEYIANE